MKILEKKKLIVPFIIVLCCIFIGFRIRNKKDPEIQDDLSGLTFNYEEIPLERNGIFLHLDCMRTEGT